MNTTTTSSKASLNSAAYLSYLSGFETASNVGGALSAGISPPLPLTVGLSFGGAIVYDLPWDQPEAYEGRFHEFTATVNPEGVGGYVNHAVPPGDTYFSIGDGPWSIGGGLNFGLPGGSASYGSTWYWTDDHFRQELEEIREQLQKVKIRLNAEAEPSEPANEP